MNHEIVVPPEAMLVAADTEPAIPQTLAAAEETQVRRSLWRRALSGIVSMADWLFGFVSLVLGLAIFSVIPLLNFLSLGYLLHVSGRVAATGRLRDGFIGVRKASLLGSFVAGTWLVMWPARFASGMWKDAELIAPGGATAQGWRVALMLITVLTLWHIAWACLRGGRLQHFLWPAPLRFWRWLRDPEKYGKIRNAVVGHVVGLRLPFYFWLGVRGFVGALAWLIVPVGILIVAANSRTDIAALLSFPGALLLLITAIHLPFLQAHFARTRRFGAMFEWREVRALFRRAPLAWWAALLITLLFALPLYLLKIELTPRELAWLPSLVFVAFIFPARLLTGWAMSRALRREQPRHFIWRWLGRLAIVPVALIYVLFVYLMPFMTWNGATSLLEQHAFLVPAPLMAR